MKRSLMLAFLLLSGCSAARSANDKSYDWHSSSRIAYYREHNFHHISEYDDIALRAAASFRVNYPFGPNRTLEQSLLVKQEIDYLRSLGYTVTNPFLLPYLLVKIADTAPDAVRKQFFILDALEGILYVSLTANQMDCEGNSPSTSPLEPLYYLPPSNKIEGRWYFSSRSGKSSEADNTFEIRKEGDSWAVLGNPGATGSFDGRTLLLSETWDPAGTGSARYDTIDYVGEYRNENSFFLGQYRTSLNTTVSTGSFWAVWQDYVQNSE